MIDNKTYRERRDEILKYLHAKPTDDDAGCPYNWRPEIKDSCECGVAEAAKALDDLVLEVSSNLPERGFTIPKAGTPDHAAGVFTRLISEQELRQIITGDES